MSRGIRIAGKTDLLGARPSDVQLDTELETLPIVLFGQWQITVYNGYQPGVPPFLEAQITHGLGYVPLFKAWEVIVVAGETTFQKVPTGIDANGFITDITADSKRIYVRAEYTGASYAGASYKKQGYLYIYEKEFKGLPT